ncbi:MAG: N-acetyltransferase [bacterium]
MYIRKAKIKDVQQIQQLINLYVQEGKLLPRSLSELYERIRDFFIAEIDSKIIGCCALHVVWEDLAEIRSLAVTKEMTNQGVGAKLLDAVFNSAKELEIGKLFVLTYTPDFFKAFGFKLIDKSTLPHKIWGECIKCIHFPNCDEEALIYEVGK